MTRQLSDKLRFKFINPQIKGPHVLDIGSSEGRLHDLLVKANKNIIFYTLDVDGHPDFKVDLNGPVNLHKKFDTIIAGEIIEHLENPSQFLRFCSQHLEPKGRLILTTPNAIGLQYLRDPSWCVNRDIFDQHLHTFTLPMLELLLKKANLKPVYSNHINAFWLNRNPLQIIPLFFTRLKTDLIIVGEK